VLDRAHPPAYRTEWSRCPAGAAPHVARWSSQSGSRSESRPADGCPSRPPTCPIIDALAAQGVLFERAIARASSTLPSHRALFASREPSSAGRIDYFGRACIEATTASRAPMA
jgi:arylsulfatase A-like enzyme